ncbi:hypothetical protein ACJX0J_022300, partial [Zea mays]
TGVLLHVSLGEWILYGRRGMQASNHKCAGIGFEYFLKPFMNPTIEFWIYHNQGITNYLSDLTKFHLIVTKTKGQIWALSLWQSCRATIVSGGYVTLGKWNTLNGVWHGTLIEHDH